MRSFALDENGDLLIEKGQIQMVHGSDLTKQKIKTVLNTQKGEWFLNWQQGINRNEILGKRMPEEEEIISEMQDGVSQVDENMVASELEMEYNKQIRELKISFVAHNTATNETTEINEVWR